MMSEAPAAGAAHGALWPRLCQAAGIEVCGVCGFSPSLCKIPCRAAGRLPAGARSVLLAALPYFTGAFHHRNVARYAMPEDYHAVAGRLLAALCAALSAALPGELFVPFSDISPIDEVEAAVRAGLGVRGENGQLINQKYGSYIFIAEVVTTAAFPPTAPLPGGCLGCGRCVRACPTGALGPGGLRRERCLSHLSQKKRLTGEEEALLGQRGRLVWGCDDCSDACPMNAGAAYTPLAPFYRSLCAVVRRDGLGAAFEGRAYTYKGQALLLRNLGLLGEGDGPPPRPNTQMEESSWR